MARNMREVRGFLCNDEYVIQKAKVTVHHFVETEAWAQILPRDRDEDVEVGEVGDDPVSHASSAAEVDVMSLKLKLLFLLKMRTHCALPLHTQGALPLLNKDRYSRQTTHTS